jgi:hypothetical protein
VLLHSLMQPRWLAAGLKKLTAKELQLTDGDRTNIAHAAAIVAEFAARLSATKRAASSPVGTCRESALARRWALDGEHPTADEALESSGWQIVELYADNGISGAKGRDQRPGFDRLLRDATGRRINMIAAWALMLDELARRPRLHARR